MRLVDQGAAKVMTASFPGAKILAAASASVGVNASVAETTLKANQKFHFAYQPGDKLCFGCGQEHGNGFIWYTVLYWASCRHW